MSNRYTKACIEKFNILESIREEVFCALFSCASTGPLFQFPSFELCGRTVDGIGCHYGLDRSLYYDLYCSPEKIVSMDDWRMDEFLGDLPASELKDTLNELKPVERTIDLSVPQVENYHNVKRSL